MSNHAKAVPSTPSPNFAFFLDKDLAGCKLVTGYWLELEHGLMGQFPALTSHDNEPFLVLDLTLLSQLFEHLSKRPFKVSKVTAFLEPSGLWAWDLGVVVSAQDGFQTDKAPIAVLSLLRYQELVKVAAAKKVSPFKWAPGLLGPGMNEAEFRETLQVALARHAPPPKPTPSSMEESEEALGCLPSGG